MEYWTNALPQAVEAIFFPANSSAGEAFARRVRDAFRETFNTPDGVPPLVRYHDYVRNPTDTPFELVEPPPQPSNGRHRHQHNHNRNPHS